MRRVLLRKPFILWRLFQDTYKVPKHLDKTEEFERKRMKTGIYI